MKTGKFRQLVMVTSVVLGSAFMFSGCDKDDDNNNNGTTYNVSGNASGTQMVPTVTGTGSADISGTYNTNTKVLTYTSNWTGLTGGPTTAGFYNGASGTAGTSVGTTWTLGSGLSGTGTVSSSMTLTTDQEAQLLAGTWYYAYSTITNPSGEVRGQITTSVQ